jgi:hypothetical protein
MSISQEDLFKLALNLRPPWYIDSIDFDLEEKQLDIHIDFHWSSVKRRTAMR